MVHAQLQSILLHSGDGYTTLIECDYVHVHCGGPHCNQYYKLGPFCFTTGTYEITGFDPITTTELKTQKRRELLTARAYDQAIEALEKANADRHDLK